MIKTAKVVGRRKEKGGRSGETRVVGARREAGGRVRRRQCEFAASTGEYSFIKLGEE